jgi:methionyl aminopeptidase
LSISINDEIIHGLPGDVILKENDLVSIDCGLDKDGFFSDAAFTKYISKSINDIKYRLLKVTEEALLEGIKIATCGNRIQDIGYTIQTMAVNNGFGVLKRFVGHGTGFNLHEDPKIFNYVDEYNINWRLRPGMVIAIEPILVEDSCEIYIDKNGWTAKTLDGGMSAHFEHTIAITEDGSIILSKL